MRFVLVFTIRNACPAFVVNTGVADQKRTKIDPKSTQNRSKIEPKSSQIEPASALLVAKVARCQPDRASQRVAWLQGHSRPQAGQGHKRPTVTSLVIY